MIAAADDAIKAMKTKGPIPMFLGLDLGPLRLTLNYIYPRRGRWNLRVIWEPGLYGDWGVKLPIVAFLRGRRLLLRRLKAEGST